MGYVPASTVPEEGSSAHVPRRQRGRSRAPRSQAAHRRRLGAVGEEIAAGFLRRRGCRILGRNVRVGRSEFDLVIRDGSTTAVVEVKTGDSAIDHFDASKIDTLQTAMARIVPRPARLDLVTVSLDAEGVVVRWVRNAA